METIDLNLDYTEKEFSLSFKGTDKYDVYSGNDVQENGYVLKEIRIIISIEIDNPLKDKNVKFNFKDKENILVPYIYDIYSSRFNFRVI